MMGSRKNRLRRAAATGAATWILVLTQASWAETAVERGRYLATLMHCGGCHTTGSLVGREDETRYLAGSDIGWLIPKVGVFYPGNLTPDRDTGIGEWSEDDIVKALKTGVIPGGRVLMPIMPWRAYANATDADLHAIAAYLKTIPAVHHPVNDATSLDAVKTPYQTIVTPQP